MPRRSSAVPLSRYGVCYDLEVSPYSVTWGGWRFMFSSPSHADRFDKSIEKHIEWLNDSLSNRWTFHVRADEVAVFDLYRKVETRGFCVYPFESDAPVMKPGRVNVYMSVGGGRDGED